MTASAGDRPGAASLVGVLGVAVVAYAFQQTAIIPAIPDVQHALHTSREWSAWLLSAYLMVATAATPALGRVADLWGSARTLLLALLTFVAGSIVAAAAPTVAVLIVARAVQGVGGAVFPLTFTILREELPEERVPGAIGLLTGGFGLGTALGFGLGGLLAEAVSWRLIFWVGAAAIAVGTGLVAWRVPRRPGPAAGRFDVRGTLLLAASAVALLVGLTLGVRLGWGGPLPVAAFVVAVVAGALWVRSELAAGEPVIDLSLFRNGAVLRTNLATVAVGWGLFGSYFLLPDFVRADPGRTGYGLGAGAAAAGLYLLPAAVGQLVAGPLARPLARRLGEKAVFAAGLALLAAALAALAATTASAAQVVVATLVIGTGAGLALQTSSAVVTGAVDPAVTGVSTSLNSAVRRFFGGIGSQVSAIALAAVTMHGGEPRAAAYTIGFAVAAGLALAGAGLVAWPDRRRGRANGRP